MQEAAKERVNAKMDELMNTIDPQSAVITTAIWDAEKTRDDNAPDRINGHHLHGRELIGGFHEPDLRCQRGTGPTGE